MLQDSSIRRVSCRDSKPYEAYSYCCSLALNSRPNAASSSQQQFKFFIYTCKLNSPSRLKFIFEGNSCFSSLEKCSSSFRISNIFIILMKRMDFLSSNSRINLKSSNLILSSSENSILKEQFDFNVLDLTLGSFPTFPDNKNCVYDLSNDV